MNNEDFSSGKDEAMTHLDSQPPHILRRLANLFDKIASKYEAKVAKTEIEDQDIERIDLKARFESNARIPTFNFHSLRSNGKEPAIELRDLMVECIINAIKNERPGINFDFRNVEGYSTPPFMDIAFMELADALQNRIREESSEDQLKLRKLLDHEGGLSSYITVSASNSTAEKGILHRIELGAKLIPAG